MPQLLDPTEAWERIERHLSPGNPEKVERANSRGRVLATPLEATLDVPPNDMSAMDGFALHPIPSETSESEAIELPIAFTVAAGDPPGAKLPDGSASRIMTGAPVPDGADRVVPIELTEPSEVGVLIRQTSTAGQHIRRRAEVVRAGEPLLDAGHLITPGTLSLLATHGLDPIPVIRRPSVSFLTTGSEVVPSAEVPKPGQIRDSHSDFFAAVTSQLGIEAGSLGIAPDDRDILMEKLGRGLQSDVLLISGGVSMGDFDLVEGALDDLGGEVLFDAVAIQPGKPVVVARHPGGWIFALPGNPASAMVTFWLFVRPALRRMMGFSDGYWHGALAATLCAPLPGAKGRVRFLPADVRFEGGRVLARPSVPLGSHDVGSYGNGTALVRIPAGSEPKKAGEACEVLPLIEWPAAEQASRGEP